VVGSGYAGLGIQKEQYLPAFLMEVVIFRPALRKVQGSPEPYVVQGAFRI